MTLENPIIEEIRRTREQMLAKHNGNLDLLINELQKLSVERTREGQPLVAPPELSNSDEQATAKKAG